jgi:hypothetical protein
MREHHSLGFAWVGRVLRGLLRSKEIWATNIIRTSYMTTWACQLWRLETRRRNDCSNMITTQSISTSQWSNDSTITQSQYCHEVHNPLMWILSNTSVSIKTSPLARMTFGTTTWGTEQLWGGSHTRASEVKTWHSTSIVEGKRKIHQILSK